MKRVKETKLRLKRKESNIIGHLCYAAFKLWNVLNYERLHYEEMGIKEYPDWYYQKKKHKAHFFARNLPSQTAQEIAKQLDKSWKSYFVLLKNKGIVNPKPPKFKQDKIPVTYMQNAIVHNGCNIRLSLPKELKEFMKKEYGIDDNYLSLSNPVFEGITSTGDKRKKRGIYIDGEKVWNADSIGAYNILRLYGQMRNKEIHMEPIKTPYVVKVAV